MAWGIEIPIDWQHPLEKMRLDTVYPEFIEFAKDESKQTNPTWYTTPDLDKVYLD
jgi:LruC domain-containing protein